MIMIVILRECLSQRKFGDDKETIKQNQYQKSLLTKEQIKIFEILREAAAAPVLLSAGSRDNTRLRPLLIREISQTSRERADPVRSQFR